MSSVRTLLAGPAESYTKDETAPADVFPSSLCNSCTRPCSEEGWNFSIEDMQAGDDLGLQRKSKGSGNRGRVLYRRARPLLIDP